MSRSTRQSTNAPTGSSTATPSRRSMRNPTATPAGASAGASAAAGAGASATQSTNRRTATAAELPPYQHPQHALGASAQQKLEQLLRSRRFEGFERSLQTAIDCLNDNAAAVNDRVREKDEAVRKEVGRWEREKGDGGGAGEEGQGQGEGEDGEEAERIRKLQRDLQAMRSKVEGMTDRMDADLRKMIDTREYHGAVQPALKHARDEAFAYAALASSQVDGQHMTGTQTRSQRRRARGRRHGGDELDDDDDDDDDGEEEYRDFEPTDPANAQALRATQLQQAPPPEPSVLFRQKLHLARQKYQHLSLTARYARDNDYRTFKAVVHDARHGDDEIPLPHENTWFPEDNNENNNDKGQSSADDGGEDDDNDNDDDDDDDDEDIQIARQTTSTKCPLTLQEFRDPVTSRKCVHSFERQAIEGMIGAPSNTLRLGGGTVGPKAVQCPVPGCDKTIALADLHTDVLLVRKIRRIQRANAEEEEDEDEDDEGRRSTGKDGDRSNPQEIDSGDDDDDDADGDVDMVDAGISEAQRKRIKMERQSGISASQRASRG